MILRFHQTAWCDLSLVTLFVLTPHPPSCSPLPLCHFPLLMLILVGLPPFTLLLQPVALFLTYVITPCCVFTRENLELGVRDERKHAPCIFLCLDYLHQYNPFIHLLEIFQFFSVSL